MEPKEYLNQSQSLFKWYKIQINLRAGQLMLLTEYNRNPFEWNLAWVEAIHLRTDGLTYIVDVTTNGGSFHRNISKLCPLTFKEDVG
ncbi:hypothetical protein NPIL_296341 [Nephila pilipes]|uniref:DUF5641 domain-containing protein n=1 Tax=Nephila pilipes TaxID=299642 RepID=A0A8X6N2D8_NEPPI|nr:hypothetical protein NPIL_296341 [Nephila pilipes]